MMTEEEVTMIVKTYFGKSLKRLTIIPSAADYLVMVEYTDFKSEANAMRELSSKLANVEIDLEREITDRCWMQAIDRLAVDEPEILVKDVSGDLKSFTYVGYLIDFMRATDFLN